MKFTIVTGLSGAGRSSALRRLEDLGYYCVDNLMPELLPEFASRCRGVPNIDRVAAAVDMRTGDMFDAIYDALATLREIDGVDLDILFLDASDEVLVRRFKEVRRQHPVSGNGEIVTGVQTERAKLSRLRDMAGHVIDTSNFSVQHLRRQLDDLYLSDDSSRMLISIISFGYKRGIPLDADMIFDMRFIPNPFWIEELRPQTGLDAPVRDYVLSFEQSGMFLDQITDLVNALCPHYLEQDKRQLVIGIGCTGGMHRSVAMAEELRRRLRARGLRVNLDHRDIALEKGAQT